MNNDLLATNEWVNANTAAVLGARSCQVICELSCLSLQDELEVAAAYDYFHRAGEILNSLGEL